MIMISQFDAPARRKATRRAILAVSASFAAIAAPAYAQCAEGPPDNYACSGTTNVPQVIADDDVTVVADNGFAVDTSNNGNGLALSISGNGLISYTGGDRYTGAGVRIVTTGASANSPGEILALSNADIFANGTHGLYLENQGSGETVTSWLGTVANTGGNGVFARGGFNANGLSLIVKDVTARDIGIAVSWSGGGDITVTAVGPVTGQNGSGVGVSTGPNVGNVDLTFGDVTGGTYGIRVFSEGTGFVQVDAQGTVTAQGLVGIDVDGGANTTGVRVLANVVNGQSHGIITSNFGTGDTAIVTTGAVTAADAFSFGINASNDVTAGNLSITSTDVTAAYGIAATNDGTGSNRIISTGNVVGFDGEGIIAKNGVNATDLLVDVHNVEGTQGGVRVENLGSGDTVVRSSGTVSGATTGIWVTTGAASQSVSIDAVDATSNSSAILLDHKGAGPASVNATGNVVATLGTGISASIGTGSTDLRVTAVNVSGGNFGIRTLNEGTGSTFIAVTGLVVGGDVGNFNYGILAQNREGLTTDFFLRAAEVRATGYGIVAESDGLGTMTVIADKVTSGTQAAVRVYAEEAVSAVDVTIGEATGGTTGIEVFNLASGSASIKATGNVIGIDGDGIIANNGVNATDLLIDVHNVEGGLLGIRAQNFGSGITLVRSDGTILAGGQAGIRVETGTGGQGVLVDVNEVKGGGSGILVVNEGAGPVRVSATGRVIGTAGSGIAVDNGNGGTDVRIDAATVSGGNNGIRATNRGTGETFVATTGLVSGQVFGILAQNDTTATDLTVHATDVQSQGDAILAENFGSGETNIVTTGSVVAQNQVGIRVFADTSADDVTVEAANVSGGFYGISVTNLGLGDTRVTVNGIVQGGDGAINIVSGNGQQAVVINNGTIRNASGQSADRAIIATGAGAVGIGNTGTLTGTVAISGTNSLMLNSGSWRSIGGTSSFGTNDDELFNSATGTIVGGALSATSETTTWQGLERFQNAGLLRLQDGGTGDVIQTSAATSFANASVLAVDIGGTTGTDTYRTTGTAQIASGARLQSNTVQPLTLYGKHIVVQADGGLTGQFSYDDKFLTAFAGLRDGYTANTAYIEFVQLKPLAAAGLTPNQKAAAGGADSLPNGNPVKDALLLLPTDAAAQAAFDQLSGEIHPSARGAMVEDSRLVRSAVMDRLADAEPGWAVWGKVFGTSGLSDGDFNAAEVDRDARGGVIGADRSFGPVTIGIAGGWSDTDVRIDRRDSSGSIESIHGMIYAGGRFGPFGLRGGIGYARTSIETTRRIAFPGFSASPTASYDGSVLHGFVEAGYRLPLGGGHAEPFASVAVVRARTDAFTEASGPAALSGAAINEETTSSMLGVRFETSGAGPFSVRGATGWRHSWGDLEPVGRHAFAGGTPFTILGATGSRDAGLFNAEAQFRLSSNVTLSIGYDGVLGTDSADHAITGGLKIVF